MRKSSFVLTGLLALAAAPVLAQARVSDDDGSGDYSFAEVSAAYPGLSAEGFGELDLNGDGALDIDELAAAEAAGKLPE